MKQTFVVEIESPDILEREGSKVRIDDLRHYLTEGIKGDFRPWCAEKFVISIVEQSSGTPENTSQKALDLLENAAQTIAQLSDKLSDSGAYALGLSIEEYIRERETLRRES